VLADLFAVLGLAADAANPPVVEQQLADGEPLPDLGAGLGGRVDQQLVSTVRRGP
jgi:hypothetical protein